MLKNKQQSGTINRSCHFLIQFFFFLSFIFGFKKYITYSNNLFDFISNTKTNIMDSNMMQPSVYGDFSSNPFDDSVGGFNNIYNDPNKTMEEKLEAGAYDVPSHSGPAYDSDGFPEATNNQNELSGQIDSNSELIDSKKMQGSLSDVALTNGDEPSKKSVIGDDADDNKDDTVDKNELAPEEKQFKAGFWHPMKCYTHSILQVSGTRFYIHWSLIALVVIQLALSLAWPGYWPQFHLWLGFRIISPVFYFVNLILISTLAIFITKWKFKGKYYYFVLFCFGIFNRLKTDIDGFKARIMYYLLVPVLHIVFAIFWWILATIGGMFFFVFLLNLTFLFFNCTR